MLSSITGSLGLLCSVSLLSTIAVATASPHAKFVKVRREVPQEHSHEQFITTVRSSLQLDNPRQIRDPIFGLLGNAAAAQGATGIDPTCLQQATADQAFTNAKAKKDVAGMTAALVYRALERNTPGVGKASAPCVLESAKNKEIAALHQHQDPASPKAAASNKATTLALAVQIASIGGDPAIALKSGTFSPGNLSDNSGKGNTCDEQNDAAGCIFSQNKLVQDATLSEIQAAVGGAGGKAAVVAASSQATATSASLSVTAAAQSASVTRVTVTVQPTDCPLITASATLAAALAAATDFAAVGEDCVDANGSTIIASSSAAAAAATATAAPVAAQVVDTVSPNATPAAVTVTVTSTLTVSATGCAVGSVSTSTPVAAAAVSSGFANNLQKFKGALGKIAAPAVAVGGRGFVVDGEPNSSDLRVAAALQRSCSIQHNKCANLANSGKGSGFSTGDCDTQNNACQAA